MGFYNDHCVYLPAMLGWFTFSAALSSYNKRVFGNSEMAFPCPLFLTSIHFLMQWLFSLVSTTLFPSRLGGDAVRRMSWSSFLRISIPCGLVTSLDVGLSNLALVRITMTFYTMIKSSSPIFVLAFAFLFGIESVRCRLVAVVLVISFGLYLTVRGEVVFDGVGFLLCLGSSILSGLRWTLVQLLLSRLEPPLRSTVETMRVLAPSMFLTMLVLTAAIERPWIALDPSRGTDYFEDFEKGLGTVGLGLLGATLAISMVLCEFHLIMNSSAMVLMIGGVLKELITIFVGVEAFHDRLNATNVFGCSVIFSGAVMYKIVFHIQKREEKAAEEAARVSVEYEPIRVDHAAQRPNGDRAPDPKHALRIEEYLVNQQQQHQQRERLTGDGGNDDDARSESVRGSDDMELTDVGAYDDEDVDDDDDDDKWAGIDRLREDLDDGVAYNV